MRNKKNRYKLTHKKDLCIIDFYELKLIYMNAGAYAYI